MFDSAILEGSFLSRFLPSFLRISYLLTLNYNSNNKINVWETRTATFRLGMLKKLRFL